MFVEYNPNPSGKRTEDCTVRALSKALGLDWDSTYVKLSMTGMKHKDLMHKNYVWDDLLRSYGFKRYAIPNTCPDCYTVADFAADHPRGLYVLGTGDHVVTIESGDWFDTWDSGDQVPLIYYWRDDNGISV